MRISKFLWIPLLSVAAACGGSGSSASAVAESTIGAASQNDAMLTDSQIIALVYDNHYSVPAGFYVDERAQTDRSFTIHHVLDNSDSYEVCTDDYAEALAWEEADNASRSVQGYFVESYENERYFEFARELSYNSDVGNIDDITSPGFGRVFKCSNTSRDGVDRMLLSGFAGTLNAHPLDADSVRVFSEYLWQFTFFPNSRKKVIGMRAAETPGELQHVLELAFATNQGSGNCDLIEIVDWRFSANRQSGAVEHHFEITRTFEARLDTAGPVLCQ